MSRQRRRRSLHCRRCRCRWRRQEWQYLRYLSALGCSRVFCHRGLLAPAIRRQQRTVWHSCGHCRCRGAGLVTSHPSSSVAPRLPVGARKALATVLKAAILSGGTSTADSHCHLRRAKTPDGTAHALAAACRHAVEARAGCCHCDRSKQSCGGVGRERHHGSHMACTRGAHLAREAHAAAPRREPPARTRVALVLCRTRLHATSGTRRAGARGAARLIAPHRAPAFYRAATAVTRLPRIPVATATAPQRLEQGASFAEAPRRASRTKQPVQRWDRRRHECVCPVATPGPCRRCCCRAATPHKIGPRRVAPCCARERRAPRRSECGEVPAGARTARSGTGSRR